MLGTGALSELGVSAAAFLGALASLAAVVILGQRAGRFVPTRLVLAGVAVGYLLSAMTNFLQFHADPEQLRSVFFWLLGSVVDVLARTIDPPSDLPLSDLPLSVITAAVGSPFFLWLLRRPGRIAGASG